jgi:hypothetical protein
LFGYFETDGVRNGSPISSFLEHGAHKLDRGAFTFSAGDGDDFNPAGREAVS